jgi:hypothetical protein
VNLFEQQDSVGETPTDATETVALPTSHFSEICCLPEGTGGA